MKRKVLSLLLVCAMAAGVGACGSKENGASAEGNGSNGTSSSGKTRLTICWRDDGTDMEKNANYRQIMDAYEQWEKKDQVELDLAPINADEGNYFTKIALQLSDPGTCPDLICEDTFQLPNDTAAGYLTNLDEYLKGYDDWNNGMYYETVKKSVTVDGSVYGIPYCSDTRGIWYNKGVLQDAGVITEGEEFAPKNWKEILDACAKIKQNCPDVVPFWCNSGVASGEATSMQTYEMLLYGTGERLLTDDGKWLTKSEGIQSTLQFISDIYSNGYGPSLSLVLNGQAGNTSVREYLPQGKLGMSMDGIWATSSWKEGGAAAWDNYENEVGFAAMPTSEGQNPGSITLAGGWAFSVPEKSDQKDLAFEFIQEMMKPEVYIGAILRHGSISTRTDVAENTEYASQPFFQTATQFLETADFRPQDEKYPVVSASIQQMAESVVSGKSPEDAIKQYTIDVTRIVGEENIAQ